MNGKETVRGIDYLNLALLAFGGLGLELVLVLIEPFIYGQEVSFENWTILSHWSLTYILWGIALFLILKSAKNKYNFKIKENRESVKLWQWGILILIIIIKVYLSYLSWDGFKLIREFESKGMLKFIMQHIYYFIETGLFTLIIIFSQKAFEKWFKNKNIPYGGLFCALTWGIAHIFTKGSLEVGILGAILGFGFGAAYLLLNRDTIKTFIVLFILFIL